MPPKHYFCALFRFTVQSISKGHMDAKKGQSRFSLAGVGLQMLSNVITHLYIHNKRMKKINIDHGVACYAHAMSYDV
eukprot:scaffold1099_cov143-Skeletonema_dohrnii-CCMP3373.AAC.6